MSSESIESNTDVYEIIQQATDFELDIYERLIQLCKINNYTRPISIYVALLEDGKLTTSMTSDIRREMRKACIEKLIKLARCGILQHSNLDDDMFTDYTLFKAANNDKFRYFCSTIMKIERERKDYGYCDLTVESNASISI